MGTLASGLLVVFWILFERSTRRRLSLKPYTQEQLKEIFSRHRKDPYSKSLRAVSFSGVVLYAFSLWEGCLWTVLEKNWGLWGFMGGLVVFLGMLALRQKDYRSSSAAATSCPLRPSQAFLFVTSLFFLNGPIVPLSLGLWFLIRIYLYSKDLHQLPARQN